MAEEELNVKQADEELKVHEDEGDIKVGGEEELKVKPAENELKVKQKAEGENTPEDEKKEATVENEPEETSGQKPYSGEFETIKEQDISQYLWDTVLKYLNKGLQSLHNKTINAIDRGISKRERGPADPSASKEDKVKHTTDRGKSLYEAGKESAEAFEKSIAGDPNLKINSRLGEDFEEIKNLQVKAFRIAHDITVSEFLHEKMSKDKDFNFASMDTKALSAELQKRVLARQEQLMSGVTATSFYSENIEGLSPREALKSCDEYLNIRENESNELKNQVIQDLEQGNFVANEKKPNRETFVKLNAYNRSFENDATVINSSLKEAISLVENTNLSAEEKLSLQEFQKKANLFQTFEAGAALDLQKQIKAVDEAYKANKNNPLRARIAAMKQAKGMNPVSAKMAQKYVGNAILKAATNRRSGRK